nr:Zinc knuckle family protein [Ipomoea batatas]
MIWERRRPFIGIKWSKNKWSKLHIGGDLVWHPTTGYKDGGVEYFDHFNCHEGSLLDLRRMVKQLRFCDKKVQFWVLVKGKGRKNSRKPELKPLINDADIVNLVGDVPPNKELDIFVEHLFDDQWDYDVEISRELGDDCLLYDESSENEVEVDQESENEVEEDNLIDSGTSSKQVNPNAGLDCDEVQEVDCELSEEVLRSLENSDDSDGELNVLENVFQESDLKKEGFKFVIGMIFKSADEFKWAVKYHEATRRKDIHFIKNEGRRVRVICRHSSICKWTIFASRSNPRSPFAVKTYCPEHTCGDQDENKTVNSGFLAKMYKDDIKLNTEWERTQFQEHVKAKLKCHVSKHQAYRAKLAAYLRAYEPAIQPILSLVLWPKSNLPDPLPPKYKAQPGRPKKKRKINPIEESKKGTTEMKTRKVWEVKRCTVCGVQGHNKKTCKGLNPQVFCKFNICYSFWP